MYQFVKAVIDRETDVDPSPMSDDKVILKKKPACFLLVSPGQLVVAQTVFQ